mmetsp:Transcript_66508/g.143430  ORF Transcript_66508/g.143430 Transcript_66508/m.143430 type:complete len:249 (-) Transcript_66508:57-803(-)|eukprot:CAMPEP_0116905418 /NCGR_PEP_ID=MMETSP0467-20121206/11971_1 /TAXON_ID=283647 /ORGANISM="Mesodinium pulex, Strain SPMC105" /LENGTH=248 /DNA_ID=CAMNT_0004580187 /DNA_START=80 /DNA_END=826 /DNA_ORIENTATION=+
MLQYDNYNSTHFNYSIGSVEVVLPNLQVLFKEPFDLALALVDVGALLAEAVVHHGNGLFSHGDGFVLFAADLPVEDGEVELEPEALLVQGVEFCCTLGGFGLVLLGEVHLFLVVLVEFAAVAQLVAEHLEQEGLVFGVFAGRHEFLGDDFDELLDALEELGFDVVLVVLDLGAPLLVVGAEEVECFLLGKVGLLHVAEQFSAFTYLVLERAAEHVTVVVSQHLVRFAFQLLHEGLLHIIEFFCVFLDV